MVTTLKGVSSRKLVQQEITQSLYRKGITTYFNVPLITGVNDNREEIQRIGYKSRSYGLKFHHVYFEGLSFQQKLNRMQLLPWTTS